MSLGIAAMVIGCIGAVLCLIGAIIMPRIFKRQQQEMLRKLKNNNTRR